MPCSQSAAVLLRQQYSLIEKQIFFAQSCGKIADVVLDENGNKMQKNSNPRCVGFCKSTFESIHLLNLVIQTIFIDFPAENSLFGDQLTESNFKSIFFNAHFRLIW